MKKLEKALEIFENQKMSKKTLGEIHGGQSSQTGTNQDHTCSGNPEKEDDCPLDSNNEI